MSVNPSELKLFAELDRQSKKNPTEKSGEMTVSGFRAMSDMFLQYTGKAADVPFKNYFVTARDGYQIPIRIYNHQLDANKPVFIMYPGCGYFLDLFEVNAVAASRIASYGNIKVIIVNFRICPEVKMPTPIYDAYDATKYIALHARKFKINQNEIFIGGVSSGAHAAANISSMSRYDKELTIKHQILVNGSYDLTQSQDKYKKYELEDKICQRGDIINFMFAQYGVTKKDLIKSFLSPVFEKNVSGMPDTTFLIAEYDGIRSDSEAYYLHLKSENNNIERVLLPGQTHNTIIMREAMTDGEDPALTIATVIKQSLNRG